MFIKDRQIVNISRFKKEIEDKIDDRNVIISSPLFKDNIHLKPISFQILTNEILKFSDRFPHHKCAVTFKTNNESIVVEVSPVTDAA